MATTPAIQPASVAGSMERRERRRWIAALVIAFVLGFLLAWYLLHRNPLNCNRPLADNGAREAGKGHSGTHGAPDKGSGVKLGAPGDGDSSRRASHGTTTADGGGGAGGKGGPGDGDLGHGTPWRAKGDAPDINPSPGSSGTADPVSGPDAAGDLQGSGGDDGKTTLPQELHGQLPQQGTGPVSPPGDGALQAGTATPASAPVSSGNPVPDALVAKDLRYDKSELPRYPDAVTQTASGTPLAGPKPADPNLSVSTILTRDELPKVAAWYHDHLPGWSEQNLGQMAMFWPPDRKADPRTVWLVVDPKTGQTGAILWKPKKKEP